MPVSHSEKFSCLSNVLTCPSSDTNSITLFDAQSHLYVHVIMMQQLETSPFGAFIGGKSFQTKMNVRYEVSVWWTLKLSAYYLQRGVHHPIWIEEKRFQFLFPVYKSQ